MAATVGHPEHWEPWGSLLHSVRTGETAVQRLRGAPIVEYLDANPEYAAVFNDAKTGVAAMAIEMAVPLYDFTDRKLVVDVDGGLGALLAADGKLLLMELVLPEGATAHPGMLLDLEMLVKAGGRERTADQFRNLWSRAGFRLTRVIPTAGPLSIVEAVPVSS
jgi:hypothetical protein